MFENNLFPNLINRSKNIFKNKNSIFILSVLCLLIFIVYSNTFHASWHLDDHPNIVNNYYLHIDSLRPDKLIKIFFTDPHNPEKLGTKVYRPVSCLSFALNWFFGQDDVFGYHLVNILIHIFTAFFLFLFILSLFDTPNLKKYSCDSRVFIAFLASLLWAVNPIQTQAVTYIVQRMAQLAAFFYILGMLAYVKARLSASSRKQLSWFFFCIIFYALAFNSKPNAIIMPLSMILVEIVFFQDLADKPTQRKLFFSAVAVTMILFSSVCFFFFKADPLSFLNWYDTRSFTFTERLLAQPRVVLFYLSQIFYPMPGRFSIAHDIVLSNSVFTPWTTLPSIIIIFFLIGFSLLQIRKRPFLSFAILFFFLNHIVESSILALEIIFEHRNYLPSFFLFLPVALVFSQLFKRFKNKNNFIYFLTICLLISIVGFFSASTYIRNRVWKDDITLWTDAVEKAPNNARASNILAIKLAWGENSTHPRRYDMALKLFEDSLEKHIPSSYIKADIYGNMALIYFYHKNDPQKAFENFDKALKIHPENLKIRRDLVNALIVQKQFDEAMKHVEILLERNSSNGRYHNLKGHILVWQGHYEPALDCFRKAYELLSDKTSVVLNSGVALSLAGRYEKAEILLLEGLKRFPEDMTFYFALIENSHRAGDAMKIKKFAEKMFDQFTPKEVELGINSYADNPRYAPISKEILQSAISKSQID